MVIAMKCVLITFPTLLVWLNCSFEILIWLWKNREIIDYEMKLLFGTPEGVVFIVVQGLLGVIIERYRAIG